MGKTTNIVMAFVFVAALAIIIGPVLVIWALNTLFGLGIAYGLAEWAAVVVLSIFLKTRLEYKKG
jgi:5-bromo-4-chloroindolyl phosphate hydrolysis protein